MTSVGFMNHTHTAMFCHTFGCI